MRFFVVSFIITTIAFANTSEKVCVKNELSSGTNLCESFPKFFTYAMNADPDALFETCVRVRTASFCENAPKEFIWVTSKSKEKVCVQHYAETASEFCTTNPKSYSWILIDGPRQLQSSIF